MTRTTVRMPTLFDDARRHAPTDRPGDDPLFDQEADVDAPVVHDAIAHGRRGPATPTLDQPAYAEDSYEHAPTARTPALDRLRIAARDAGPRRRSC